MPDETQRPLPDTQVPDTQEFFENQSEVNAMQSALNAKRTFDEYQDLALTSARRSQVSFDQLNNVALQALQNSVDTANMVSKQAVRHADVAADALWTDELNPVTRAAGNVLTGQAPVDAQLASTASLDTAFTNLTAQNGELVTAIIGLANSVAAQNTAVTAALAQLVQNAKQNPTTTTGGTPA